MTDDDYDLFIYAFIFGTCSCIHKIAYRKYIIIIINILSVSK